MADISVEQKKGANLTWLWATLAILAVIGLMLWLASQDVEDAPVAVEQDTSAEEAGATTGEAAELSAVAAAPDTYAGRPLSIRSVTVAATVGPRAFWADIPGQNPFLVVLAPEVANPELAAQGQAVNLQGTVETVTPELIEQWVQQGAINEAQREEAAFATHALLASQVAAGQPAAAQPAQQPAQAPAGQ